MLRSMLHARFWCFANSTPNTLARNLAGCGKLRQPPSGSIAFSHARKGVSLQTVAKRLSIYASRACLCSLWSDDLAWLDTTTH